jgi:hypothetical protein
MMRVIRLSFFLFLSFLAALLCFSPIKRLSGPAQRILHSQASSDLTSHPVEDRTKPFDVPWQGKKFEQCVIPKWNRRASYDEEKCPVAGIAEHI